MEQYHERYQRFKERQMTLSDMATIYGCCGLFDMCADEDVVSLSMQGSDPLMDYLAWQPTKTCVVRKEFVAWMRPEQVGAACTAGWITDVCHDPHGVEWGKCDFVLEDFGVVGRMGPVRDITMLGVNYCERQPRYRIDGTRVNDDLEYDLVVIGEVALQDVRRYVISGNANNAGQFDGFQRLVRTGYLNSTGGACQIMDSNVINWNGNGMNGGAGITWNGTAQPAGNNFVDFLHAIYRRVRTRITWAPVLAAQQMRVGDIVIVGPTMLMTCLLDAYVCWRVCDGDTSNPVTTDNFEARQLRQQLLGGMFGHGRIYLDGFEIPLLNYDYGLINGPTTGDIYMLVGAVGNIKVFHGEYLDMRSAVADRTDEYFYTDGGRFIGKRDNENLCEQRKLWMKPRLLCWAPWAQTRFQDVVCNLPGGHLSPDPCELSFFPQQSFSVVECP